MNLKHLDIQTINGIIDKRAVDCKYWTDENDLDLKRRKEAEFLVLGDIPAGAILGFVVYDDNALRRIEQMDGYQDRTVVIRPNYYF